MCATRLSRWPVSSELELAREENIRLRRQQGKLMVRLSEAIAEAMLLRAEIERLRDEIERLKAVRH
jgi:hypothetical protein